MGLKSNIYKALKISNDINALNKGKVVKRAKRRILGKLFGKIMRRL